VALHWHGDQFDLPPNARSLGSTARCPCQGFVWGDRILATQFHLEATPPSLAELADNAAEDFDREGLIQPREELLAEADERSAALRPHLFRLLDRWIAAEL
jgi:hypothetical protein